MSSDVTPPVWFEGDSGVGRIVLDNPPGSNRLDAACVAALERAVTAAAEPAVRCVVVTATGTRFCVGGDLTTFTDTDAAATALHESATRSEHVLRALGDLPKPVVVGVHGAVAGAGLAFVLNADLVIAARSTHFVLAYTCVGLTPDCGVSYLLPRVIGQRRALQLALQGTRLDAGQALDWGLVTEVVEDAELESRAVALGAELAAGPTRAHAEAKRLLRGAWTTDRLSSAADEVRTISAAIRTPEAQQRIQAFLGRHD